MEPLLIPCLARKASSVCTSTSKIALPIPRTSYLAELIQKSCCGDCAWRYRINRVLRPITILPPRASDPAIDLVMQVPLIRSFITVSTGTLASRLLGFLRDAMLAALLGAGPVADAFLVAFQLVNVARRLLTEGALNAALVPAWLRVRDAQGTVAAAAFAGRIFATVSAALIAAALLTGILM